MKKNLTIFDLITSTKRDGYFSIVTDLIKKGADVNKTNNDGWTALMCACQIGCRDIAAALISAGADVNKADDAGWIALMGASQMGYVDIAIL